MAILSKHEINSFALAIDMQIELGYKEQFKAQNKIDTQTSVFISHKHTDKDILKKVIKILRNLGVSAYVDWLDDDMPKQTSSITAEKIKKKIIENEKFILVATDDAINSKWCNWELGYGDAQKFEKLNVALFPIRENNQDWSGSEYMGLYPIIDFENGSSDYIAREQINGGAYAYIPYFEGCDAPILGKIPVGYYFTLKKELFDSMSESEDNEPVEMKISLKDWLNMKID